MIPIGPKQNFQLAVPTQDSDLPREEATFSPMLLLAAIRRRIWLAIGIGLILAIVTGPAIWAFLPPPKPRVSTNMYMYGSEQGTLFQHPDPVLNHQAQVAVVRSDKVISVALLKPEVAQLPLVKSQADPVDWLSKSVEVTFPYGPEIMRLSMSESNTDDAIKVLNEVRMAYLEEVTGTSKRARADRKERLKKLQNEAQANLKRRQEYIEKYSEAFGSSDATNVATQQRLAIEQLGLAKRELIRAEAELRRLTVENKATEKVTVGPRPIAESEIATYVESSDEVIELLARQKRDEADIRRMDDAHQPDFLKTSKKYLDLKESVAAIPAKLKAAREKARAELMKTVNDRNSQDTNTRKQSAQQLINFQQELVALLNREVSDLQASIKVGNNANLRLESERLELKLAEDIYSRVATAIATLEAEADQPARVKPLDESATVERVDLTTRKIQFSFGGAFAAFLFGCTIVGFLEHRTRRLDSVEAIGATCGVTILGTIPRFPTTNWRALGSSSVRWQTALAEAVDCTRTFLLHGPGLTGIRSILITSAESGEGKSSFAAQLAVSFARAGLRTLLVDGDLRKPGVSMLVGVENIVGLAELLRGEVVLPDVLRNSRIPGLSVISAGHCDDYALAALAQDRNTIRSLQTLYDIVIVDSAPILPVTDPLHFARQVDGVILTTLQDFSRAPLVREAGDRLRRLGIRILGAIVNGTPNRVYGYGYHYQSTGPAIAAKSDQNATTPN